MAPTTYPRTRARLLGGISLAAINQKSGDELMTFGIDEDAVCGCARLDSYALTTFNLTTANLMASLRGRHDFAPALDGHCGWYAVPADVDAWHDPGTVDLLVELSGKVIEHEKGYRAEHQRVVEIRLPGCWMCAQPSTYALFNDGTCTQFACEYHLASSLVAVCAGDIQRVLGVPVVAEPS